MTRILQNRHGDCIVIIESEPARHCDRCNQLAELREIKEGLHCCFDCATEEEREAYVDRLAARLTNKGDN